MGRNWVLSLVSVLVGLAVVGTLGFELSGSGRYYALPTVGMASPGIPEVGVIAAGLTAVSTILAGVFSYDSPHPWINALGTLCCVGIVLGPFYAQFGVMIWAGVALTGLLIAGNGAMFVVMVESRRLIRQMKRSRRQSTGS